MTNTGDNKNAKSPPLALGEGATSHIGRPSRTSPIKRSFLSQTHALAAAQDLAERLRQAQSRLWDPIFHENGSFSRVQKQSSGGVRRAHWFFDCYQPAGKRQGTGRGVRRYIGAAGDPAVEARIQSFNIIKNKRAVFANEVAALTSSGLPFPRALSGALSTPLRVPAYSTKEVCFSGRRPTRPMMQS